MTTSIPEQIRQVVRNHHMLSQPRREAGAGVLGGTIKSPMQMSVKVML